jgi:long-subunit fatty acid transport protein
LNELLNRKKNLREIFKLDGISRCMLKTFFSLIAALLFVLPARGQNNHLIGARAAAMANAAVTSSDLWSVSHNQAGLAHLKKNEAGFYYENRYSIQELSLKGLAIATPLKSGVLGLSVTHFGFSLFSETKAGLAYSLKMGEKVSAGVQLNYKNIFIGEGFGNRGIMTAEAGFLAELTDGLTLGAHIYNPSRARIAHYNNEREPTIMRLGLVYSLSQNTLFCIEALKDTQNKPVFKAAMEYQPVENFYLRAGVSSNPSANTFGIGFYFKKIRIDMASSFHSVLGLSPMISCTYSF